MTRSPASGTDNPTLADWLATGIAEDEEPEGPGPDLPRLRLSEDTEADVDLTMKDVLGVGGMAVVTRAEQRSLGRDVAVKRSKHQGHPGSMRSLLREAWITGQLDHPNVVPVHLIGETDEGEPIVVLRAIGGTSWHEQLLTDPVDDSEGLARNLAVFTAVCNAVHYAHEQGFLHRDIKPANIQIGSFGEVYLLDWGVAAALDESVLRPAGTPAYMAPEMLVRTSPDRRSDVFLLGATLVEVLSGVPPRANQATEDILRGALDIAPLTLPDDLPPGLRPVLERATANEIDARYATAAELRDAVLAWQVDQGISRLLEAAHGRLDDFEKVAPLAISQPDDAVAALDAREKFAAARFGFDLVLAERPDHAEAAEGLGRGITQMIEVELAHGSTAAVRALLAAHPDAPESLTARVSEQVAVIEAERAERERLVKVAASYDTTGVARDVAILIATAAAGVVVGIVGTNVLFEPTTLSPGVRSASLLTPMILAIVGVMIVRRDTLLVHPVGRRLSLTMAGFMVLIVLNRASQIATGVPFETFSIGEPFLISAWLIGSSAYLRPLLSPAIFCLVGAVLNAQLRGSDYSSLSQNVLTITTACWVAVIWWQVLTSREAEAS